MRILPDIATAARYVREIELLEIDAVRPTINDFGEILGVLSVARIAVAKALGARRPEPVDTLASTPTADDFGAEEKQLLS